MAAHTLCMFLLIVHLPLVGGLAVDTILGDQVQFPETEQCRETGATLQHTLTGGSSQPVARLEDVWKPAAGYKDRMSPNESVVLNRSNINDQGLYGLTCGSEEKRIHLNVITSSEKSVPEGQAAGFTFHYFTAGELGRYRVERNTQLVFELDLSSGSTSQGSGFENRTSVAPHWRTDGDLTLTLQGVKPEDRGDYFLYVLKDRKRGHLQAVRMRVSPALNTPEERNPEQITCTPQPPRQKKTPWITIAIIAALVLVALGVVCRQRICRSNVSSGGGRSLTEEESQPITDPRVPEENGHASLA
ncbi:uncharacterized protein LOC117497954 isoform X1 [Trematomus bernacchii]|uniref:uncharacterized protein LOC117497954 isoform X1 n=2 Tax=Trematomus bernacchii TaxID=40690 RepID=UPI00146A1715|nr:uncharacterized protein LOC117497954 isoform X1 [Trematomus bernacchii]